MESVTDLGGPVLLAATAPDLRRGDVLAGRYQIEAALGNGGSGRVLRAFDRVAKTPVALKILRHEFAVDPIWTERFSRELRVGRQIQNPHVCRVFDIGEADGHRFLSMELATGGTIRAQIAKDAPPRSLDDRIIDARAVIDGVAALHAAGIVHRDVKPENILRMGDGRLVVSDFGLATDPGSGPTSTVMVGTPTYMAPEVVMGEPATIRSDVWALGVVLHEIFFARRPDRSSVSRGRRRYTLPDVTEVKERRLAELCGRCSDDVPEMRPASAVEVLREFQLALQGRRRFDAGAARRRQLMWGAAALLALASLGLIRNRWVNRAAASSSQMATSIDSRVLQPSGTPQDWSKGSTKLAAFEGHVHCLSVDRGRARVIWGDPRHAEEVDVRTGKREPAALLPEIFESGCPQTSPDGRGVLFEKTVDGAQEIFLASSRNGQGAKQLVRGSAPRWLPNGQEFSFTLDSRHAAVFAVPTREMTVVTDDVGKQFAIDDQSTDFSGSRLAILYTTEFFGSHLVVHALPSLEVIGHSEVPQWARGLRFGQSGDVLFTVLGPGSVRQLVASDNRVTVLRTLGRVPGVDVQDALESDGGRVLVTRARSFDLWRDAGSRGISPLTTDGQSVNGALSPTGKLVIQRSLTDGREVIVLRDEGGKEERVTEGPRDLTPSFLPNGTSWLHVNLNSGEIVECSVATKRCVSIHTDALIPEYPTTDPSGHQIAYVTSINASRVRVISREGGNQRDFGPIVACGPVWTSSERLWVVTASPRRERVWAEIDAGSGQRTGQVRSVQVINKQDQCFFPSELRQEGDRVFPLVKETSELLRTELSFGR